MRRIVLITSLLSACAAQSYETFELEASLPQPIDVLVVLDDTTAMATNLPRQPPPDQAGIVTYFYNGAPDVRFAVTTSTTGTLRASKLVPSGVIEHTVSLEDGTLKTNYSGTLSEALTSLTNVGASSTSPNAILASTQAALATGFVRQDAGLGILISTAGDDQSAGAVQPYVDAITAHGSRNALAVAHVDAVPRLAELADSFGSRKLMTAAEYNMSAIETFAWMVGPPNRDSCLTVTPAAVDACELFTTHNHVVRPLVMCPGSVWDSDELCYELFPEPSCAGGYSVVLARPFWQFRPAIFGRCRVD